MRIHHLSFASILFLLVSPMSAYAIPITFTFDMPAFTNGNLVGSTSVLEVTADNGGTSQLNQVFLNTQITALSTDLTGGLVAPLEYYGSAVYITTDAQGIASLDPLNGQNAVSTAVYGSASPMYIQIGSGAYANYLVQTSIVDGRGVIGYSRGADSPYPITSIPSQVTEPGTLALLAAGIGFMYRRKNVGERV